MGFEICQRRIAVMQFEAAVFFMKESIRCLFLKHPSTIASCIVLISDIRVTMFKHLKLHHRFSLLDLVTVNTLNSKVLAGSTLKFNRGSSLLRVFEAWMPMQAYTEVLTATLGRLFPLLNWLPLNLCTGTANLCK